MVGSVFLNGLRCSNGDIILHKDDFIQLAVSVKYYILFKVLLNDLKARKERLSRFATINKVKLLKPNSGLFNQRFPNWIRNLIFSFYDIPKYVEVDFFSLSVFLLYEPFFFTDFSLPNANLLTSNVINLYNWKYIT